MVAPHFHEFGQVAEAECFNAGFVLELANEVGRRLCGICHARGACLCCSTISFSHDPGLLLRVSVRLGGVLTHSAGPL